MKIGMAQLYTHHIRDFGWITERNKDRYCKKHGYSFFTRHEVYPLGADRHPSWHCIPFIQEILEHNPELDWVFWTDADSLIAQDSVQLEEFVAGIDKDFIFPNQGSGFLLNERTDRCLCLGNFFVKNTERARFHLNHLWSWPRDYKYMHYIVRQFWEQEAANYFWKNNINNFADNIHVEEDNRKFNSFYSGQYPYREGDFLIHFAGNCGQIYGLADKQALIKEFIREQIKVKYPESRFLFPYIFWHDNDTLVNKLKDFLQLSDDIKVYYKEENDVNDICFFRENNRKRNTHVFVFSEGRCVKLVKSLYPSARIVDIPINNMGKICWQKEIFDSLNIPVVDRKYI